MKKVFICLANSKKFGERCVAGIEIQKIGKSCKPIEIAGKIKWLRPVSELQHGAVSKTLAGEIRLMDIIEIDVKEICPAGYQSENVTFKEGSIKKLGNVRLSEKNLDKLIDNEQDNLFGNRGKAVSDEDIDSVDHSLTLIKVTDFKINKRSSDGQLRITFGFNGNRYDLPITDIDFIKKYSENESLVVNKSFLYLTISLGIYHNGWHSKLIAGVIHC